MNDTGTDSKQRLDHYVAITLPDSSRAAAVKLIRDGGVRVNGQVQAKASYRLRQGDSVQIDQPKVGKPEPIELNVIYQDEDCAVINKPIGLLSHSKGPYNPEATVATWLNSHAPKMTGERSGIVHRLDRATTGVMIVAKTPEALAWLQKQFSQRKVKKNYMAVIEGELDPPQAVIDLPIERNPKKPQTFRVGSNGKAAITTYTTVQTTSKYSLIDLSPETGRTHQLRVHLAYLKHPIVGDELYGGKSAERLYLHSKSLEITLPNRQRKLFEVSTPIQFDKILEDD